MVLLVYSLCALTAAACAVLLLRQYLRTRVRLLLWSGLCFLGLTTNNCLLILDSYVILDVSLLLWRNLTALLAMCVLVLGLIWDGQP